MQLIPKDEPPKESVRYETDIPGVSVLHIPSHINPWSVYIHAAGYGKTTEEATANFKVKLLRTLEALT